jgi:acetyl esterase/lipase
MRRFLLLTTVALLFGCGPQAPPADTSKTLTQARAGHVTKLTKQEQIGEPVAQPPAGVFEVIKYTAPPGEMAAYLSPDPQDGKKHPAIVWITGGDCNTIGDVWSPQSPDNDQTAAAFRKSGIVMMFPSLRGGNQNPGYREGVFGEVDDVIAAAEHLSKQPYVDPQRIYLGGHSTGGTLAMLVAASTNRFRAVFSFGPVEDIAGYGADMFPVNLRDPTELSLRAPKNWLHSIQSPTFVFEGSGQGNASSVRVMERANKNPLTKFFIVNGKDHFSILAPVNQFLAQKVLADTPEKIAFSLTAEEVAAVR